MADALLVSTPAKLEADKIAGWIARLIHRVSVGPSNGSWGVYVPRVALHRARAALKKVLAANPRARRVVVRTVRRPPVARLNATRLSLPHSQIEFVVDRLHVGTSDDEVAAEIRKRAKGGAWTPARVRRAVEYAIKHHHKNRGLFSHVMRGIPNPSEPKCCKTLGKGGRCARCGKHTHFTVDWIIPSRAPDPRTACSSACALALKRSAAPNGIGNWYVRELGYGANGRVCEFLLKGPFTTKVAGIRWATKNTKVPFVVKRGRAGVVQNPRLPRRRTFSADHGVMSQVGHLIEEGRLEEAADIVEQHTGRRPAPGTLRAKYSGMTFGGEPDIIYHRNTPNDKRYNVWAYNRATGGSFALERNVTAKVALRAYREAKRQGLRPWCIDLSTRNEVHPTKSGTLPNPARAHRWTGAKDAFGEGQRVGRGYVSFWLWNDKEWKINLQMSYEGVHGEPTLRESAQHYANEEAAKKKVARKYPGQLGKWKAGFILAFEKAIASYFGKKRERDEWGEYKSEMDLKKRMWRRLSESKKRRAVAHNPPRERRLATERKARLLLVRIHTILQVGAHKLDRGDRKGASDSYERARELWGKLPRGVMMTPANRRTAYLISRSMVHLQNRLAFSEPNRGRRAARR
jgi:hypothetical protein